MGKPGITRQHQLICVFLIIATLAVYWQVKDFDFTHFDDNIYITDNPHIKTGLNWSSVVWAFTAKYECNWIPLVWISYMVDYQIGELDPGRYHLTNVFFHIINTLLLFLVLSRMTGSTWRSAFVAALFALHPLHVESVAWLAERKDVLSTFFWFLTMLAYLHYAHRPKIANYLLVMFSFALGLMSKSMLVTLPVVLLLLDYWPLNRFSTEGRRKLILEKIPLFIMSIAAGIVTFVVQQTAGAVGNLAPFPLGVRIANALTAYVSYILKMIWPRDMACFYPHPGYTIPVWQVIASALFLIFATFLAIRLSRVYRYVGVGWLWYVFTLLPVIGLIQVGRQSMADRYTYVPLIGLFIIIAWGIPDLFQKWSAPNNRAIRLVQQIVLPLTAMVVIMALAVSAHTQAGYWRDDFKLFSHAIQVTDNNAVAHYNIANSYLESGLTDEAEKHYREALRFDPKKLEAHNNLGAILFSKGRNDEALGHFQAALRIKPDAEAHSNVATVLLQKGRIDEAIRHCSEAVKLRPNNEAFRAELENAKMAK